MQPEIFTLRNVDPDDIDDVIISLAKSFKIPLEKFSVEIKTFGNLVDIFKAQAQGLETNDCTTQQAFYKIRNAIRVIHKNDHLVVTPATMLEEVFPRHARRQYVAQLRLLLGVKANMLQPKAWVSNFIAVTAVLSLLCFFISWQLAITGILLACLINIAAIRFANELNISTVGELAQKLRKTITLIRGARQIHVTATKYLALYSKNLVIA